VQKGHDASTPNEIGGAKRKIQTTRELGGKLLNEFARSRTRGPNKLKPATPVVG